jgi:hypothetical protein
MKKMKLEFLAQLSKSFKNNMNKKFYDKRRSSL